MAVVDCVDKTFQNNVLLLADKPKSAVASKTIDLVPAFEKEPRGLTVFFRNR
jgi:hypothetical protein